MTAPSTPEGGSRTRRQLAVYRLGLAGIGAVFRVGPLAGLLARASKVLLRHARLRHLLRTGGFDSIVDGGASVGEFALAARASCPGVPLVCVEPHPPSAAILRRQGFRVVEAALWKTPGRLRLTQPTDATTSCSVALEAAADRPSWDVETVRLDGIGVTGDRILVKLDLQGAEAEALEGMGALWPRCAALLLEVSYGPAGSYEPLRSLLTARGFVEAATLNELEEDGLPLEADKLFVRQPA
ncbi:MAG: FkbM family methyltransferase [Acidobacteria bacterium]|nr:FkbM family methyltransferase [Acidobacteriota bacterium]